jgi:RNA polymerase sigma-70 factor (ECF subfamily)
VTAMDHLDDDGRTTGQERLVINREEELIARISTGDRDALIDLYEHQRRPLLSYLRLLTSDNGLAEEILQDTLFAAWNGADAFSGRSSGRTWLFGIARRRARDLLRKKQFRVVDLAFLETTPSREPEPDDVVLANEQAEALTSAFGRLSSQHQEALSLLFIHGLSYDEISEVMSVPIGTVKSRIFAAKRALRAGLEQSEGPNR